MGNLHIFIIAFIFWFIITRIAVMFYRLEYQRFGKSSVLGGLFGFAVFYLSLAMFPLVNINTENLTAAKIFSVFYSTELWPPLTENIYFLGVGFVLLAFGGIIMLTGMAHFMSPGRILGTRNDSLRTESVYRNSRNPQYVGWGLMLLAIPFLNDWQNWWLELLISISYWFGIRGVIKVEETHLRRVYGNEYENYSHRVPRYWRF